MTDGLEGDFGKLATLIRQIEDFPDEVRTETAATLRLELLKLVQDCFRTDTDPYGLPWAPLVSRSGDSLELSRVMANSFTCAPAWPLVIVNNVPYVNFHQGGTKTRGADGEERQHIPQRRMVPEPDDMPARWATPLTRATELVVETIAEAMAA